MRYTRLVKSIKRRYPMAKILVVNDSRNPKNDWMGWKISSCPTTLASRLAGMLHYDHIDTRYFLLLDDDFVFSRRQKLGFMISQMEEHGSIDILGGRLLIFHFVSFTTFKDVPGCLL